MSLSANGKVLATATTKLLRQWSDTGQHWRDAKSDEFERKYLVELQASVDRAGAVLDEIERIVKRVRDECE
jgi:hypothetical protein